MKYKLLELFKGTGSVGKVAKKLNMDIVSLDFDESFNPDIHTDILEWNYKKFYKDTHFLPDFIWASPPCNTYSPLAYPLKERNIKNAKPLSKRAKIGTDILYKTLEIILYFKKLNPKLLFVIENPKGMMRHDKYILPLKRDTTLYCLYGDNKRKETDFFNNIPNSLDLKDPKTKCNKKVVSVVDLPLNDRYKIPPRLIRHILNRMIEEY
jgi:site-specific DNA-cytosine methylase